MFLIPTYIVIGGLLYTWFLLPVLCLRVDPMLCWLTNKDNVPEIPGSKWLTLWVLAYIVITLPPLA